MTGIDTRLTDLVRRAQRDWKVPGISVGLVRDGEPCFTAHVGHVGYEPARAATDDTQFLIGSVTKTFTAVTLLALRDEGRLTLDDPLGAYVDAAPYADLTLRQLLSHSSGLQREPAGHLWEDFDAPDVDRLLAELDRTEQVLGVHEHFHYSNLAYVLLALVVEKVTGLAWEDAVRERILTPLGMTSTGLRPGDARARGYQVHPYLQTVREEPLLDLRATAPLGGLWSTVADMSRYAAFVADPAASNVLDAATVDEMCRPVIMSDPIAWTAGQGLGFGMRRRGERVYAGHSGAMPGFLTDLRVARADRLGAIVFCNATANAAPGALALDLLEALLDAEPTAPSAWVPTTDTQGLDELTGRWWSEGEPLDVELREGVLWMTMPGSRGALDDTRFERVDADTFRAAEGRERGELLEVVRAGDGTVAKMYFATYAVTREPLAFADLT